WCRVVQRGRRERHADRIEAELFDLGDLLSPPHRPKELRLQRLALEAEVADAANRDSFAVGVDDGAVADGVSGSEGGRGRDEQTARQNASALPTAAARLRAAREDRWKRHRNLEQSTERIS